jgi:hypothetical protein
VILSTIKRVADLNECEGMMESVAIFPVIGPGGSPAFRAVTRSGQSEGRTAGEALDAIQTRLPNTDSGTIVVIQPFRPDTLFTAEQQQRLEALMAQWRSARDVGHQLPADEYAELQALIEAELKAAEARTRQVLQGLGK